VVGGDASGTKFLRRCHHGIFIHGREPTVYKGY
jgi:hypothetical protein